MVHRPVRIERRRLTDQIIEQLITMIAEGKFAPKVSGLPQASLAQKAVRQKT